MIHSLASRAALSNQEGLIVPEPFVFGTGRRIRQSPPPKIDFSDLELERGF
jgi:hypothetical protein